MRRCAFVLFALLGLGLGCKASSRATCERLSANPITNDLDEHAVSRCLLGMKVVEQNDAKSFGECATCVKASKEGPPAAKACASSCRPQPLESKIGCLEKCFDTATKCGGIDCPAAHGACVASAQTALGACKTKCAAGDPACNEACDKGREDAVGACDNTEATCDQACEKKGEECEGACG